MKKVPWWKHLPYMTTAAISLMVYYHGNKLDAIYIMLLAMFVMLPTIFDKN